MVKQLRFCNNKVQFWVKVKGRKNTRKIELRKVNTDAEILGLSLDVPANKELDLYVEHLYDDQWDYEVEISRSLGDDALLTEEEDDGSEQHSEIDGPSTMFQEVDVEVNGPTSKQVENEGHVEIDEVDCVHSEEIFRSLDGSDSERECNGPENVFQERNLKKDGFKFVLGMIFRSASEFKWAVKYHEAIKCYKQKGLLPAVEKMFPRVEHKFCVRHMHGNFLKGGFTGNVLKHKLWGVCKATTDADFKGYMEELKQENEKAAEWLYLMGRMQKNRDKMKTYPHKICPKISKCLEEAKDKSARYSTYKSHDNCYQVDDQNFKAFKYRLILELMNQQYFPFNLLIYGIKLTFQHHYPPNIRHNLVGLQESRQQRNEVRTKKLGEVKRCRVCGLTGHNKTTSKAKNPQGSQEGVGSQSAPPLHNQVPHESTFFAAQGTTTATNAAENCTSKIGQTWKNFTDQKETMKFVWFSVDIKYYCNANDCFCDQLVIFQFLYSLLCSFATTGFKESYLNDVEDKKSQGLKLVPWLTWEEWSFIGDSLFSSSPLSVDSALRRISTWRNRGCIPVAVDVTASIIEIQQKDPYFRLVNGVIEKNRKKNELSIAEAAYAIGIPRMLIDVRHEGSHRDLPSLQLVRLASTKALRWLQSYYWEPKKNAIQSSQPTKLQKETSDRLNELTFYLKEIQTARSSSFAKENPLLQSAHHYCCLHSTTAVCTALLLSAAQHY
nr:uncharacterized protein LOC109177396 isoform X2 [Ipomoea trifida]